MLGKICGLARALAIILAVVAGFVAIPGLDVTLTIVVLGLVAGICYTEDSLRGLILLALVLPLSGVALAHLPMVGAQLSAVAGYMALGAASAVASCVALLTFNTLKGDLTGLTK